MARRYVRLPGSARRYRDTRTGRVLSDRQVRQARAKARGGPPTREALAIEQRLYQAKTGERYQGVPYRTIRAELERGRFQDFARLRTSFQRAERERTGRTPTLRQVERDARFYEAIGVLYAADREDQERARLGKHRLRRGSDSAKAKALVTLGLRASDATNPVGQGYPSRAERLQGEIAALMERGVMRQRRRERL